MWQPTSSSPDISLLERLLYDDYVREIGRVDSWIRAYRIRRAANQPNTRTEKADEEMREFGLSIEEFEPAGDRL